MFLMIIVVHNWFEKTKCKWTSDQKIPSPKFDKFGQMFDKFGPKNKANLGTDATTSSDKTLNRPLWPVFFPPANNQKMPKNRFAGGKKIGRV